MASRAWCYLNACDLHKGLCGTLEGVDTSVQGALEFHTQQCAVHFSPLVTTFSAGLSGLDYDEKSGSTLNVIVVFEELFP